MLDIFEGGLPRRLLRLPAIKGPRVIDDGVLDVPERKPEGRGRLLEHLARALEGRRADEELEQEKKIF